MDLLGSILGNMDAPPMTQTDKDAIKKAKEAKAKAEKLKAQEKQKWAKFRIEVEGQMSDFVKDSTTKSKQFKTMDKIARSIVHDVADVAGLASFSFGEENVDRYIMIWKKEFSPSDAEIEARKCGEEWDEEKEKQHNANLGRKQKEQEEDSRQTVSRKRNKNTEPEKYFDKYAKILGGDSGVDAAKATKTNAVYGMVPSKNKADQRSIEETMNAIRDRKRQKTSDGLSTD